MRAALPCCLLLCQLAPPSLAAQTAEPRPVRYARAVQLPAISASGQACAVLDSAVLAHSASSSANDLHLFAARTGKPETQTAFALTESGPPIVDLQIATPGNITALAGRISFDLAMPSRPYSEVALGLDAKNFLGTAIVSGLDPQDRHATPLGTFPIFDLTAQGLARSTSLPLRESSFSILHIELRLTDLAGNPLHDLFPSIVQSAAVPPSRAAQTIYTPPASAPVEQQGHWSVATFTVSAHVPVERVLFVLPSSAPTDFLRDITVTATPIDKSIDALGAAEGISGHIFRVQRPAADEVPAINSGILSIDAALGSKLRSPARVTVTVLNNSAPPLPIERVELQMRQRSLCFNAAPHTSYTLEYGDPSLRPPPATYARTFVPSATPIAATLGPEQANAHFIPHNDRPPDERQGQQLFWLIVLAVISVGGVLLLQHARHKHRGHP